MQEPRQELQFVEGAVSYSVDGQQLWALAAEQIALVGEWTDSSGPWVDDYFLAFVTLDGTRHVASFYAEGRDAVLSELGAALGVSLEYGLCASTDLASRVLWPPALTGIPLFDFIRVKPTSWRERLFAGPSFEMRFTAPVQQRLTGDHARAPAAPDASST